jgi:hypothetical protein
MLDKVSCGSYKAEVATAKTTKITITVKTVKIPLPQFPRSWGETSPRRRKPDVARRPTEFHFRWPETRSGLSNRRTRKGGVRPGASLGRRSVPCDPPGSSPTFQSLENEVNIVWGSIQFCQLARSYFC